MRISTQYTSVESVTFTLDVHDLRRAVLDMVRQSHFWPKKFSTSDVEFGDDANGEPYAEVVVRFEQPAKAGAGEGDQP